MKVGSSLLLSLLANASALSAQESGSTILQSRVHDLGDRKMTVERISPLKLPPLFVPPAMPTVAVRNSRAPTFRARPVTLHLGAMVYRFPDGSARSRVRLSLPVSGNENGMPRTVEFWSSADLTLLENVGLVRHPGLAEHALFLMTTPVDVARHQQRTRPGGRIFSLPPIPLLPPGDAIFLLDSTDAEVAPEVLEAVRIVHRYYSAELPRLKADALQRETERLAREADLKANPPQPKDLRVRSWSLSPEQAAAYSAAAKTTEDAR